ncbi:MAG: ArsR family transcriptional regulator [Corynebacterium variabile]|nr:ArsR family transcriptional regulator [Corynebacterium variabile]
MKTSNDPSREHGGGRPAAGDSFEEPADGTTRDRVMSSILHHGPSTAAQLADRLGLTPAAVRRHLSALGESGQIASREQRVFGSRGRGRPSRVFFLTDSGRADYYTAYDELAIAALKQLAAAAGPDALAAVAQARVDDIEAKYRELRAARPDQDPAQTLAESLSADGYVASLEPAVAGRQICQHNCPVAEVAKVFPELCEVETRLFSELLGSNVQRLATIAHGDGVCTTHVPVDVEITRKRIGPPVSG